MEHYYQNIKGEDWFRFPSLYSKMVNDASDGAHFVEIGCWTGRSAAYMGVEIINSKKNIQFDCVDIWPVHGEYLESIKHELSKETLDSITNTPNWLYQQFLINIEPVKNVVTPVWMDSELASKKYDDGSLDFVFIDANHEYHFVKRDIENWAPKIKSGGCIAGHDWSYRPVEWAVREYFPHDSIAITNEGCWVVRRN